MIDSDTPVRVLPVDGRPVRVVQITDTHLTERSGGTLLGMDTDHSMKAVVALVEEERPAPDLLLLTGDLSDYGSAAAYERVESYTRDIASASLWLPGNHDDFAVMAESVSDPECLRGEIRAGNWQVLMLNSQVPGQVGGELGDAELSRLSALLDKAREAGMYSLICLHHQPVQVGCAWLDEQMVSDAEELFAVIDAHPGVRGVLWGHVHQQVDVARGEVSLMASPSSCVQFAPGQERFKADDSSPGYRWLELYPDGRIECGVSRVEGVEFQVDLDSSGYADHHP